MSLKELQTEWVAALADAGIERERARLYLCDGKSAADRSTAAVWHRPGVELVVDHQLPNAGQVADANEPAHRELHRVVVWRDHEAPLLGALMRHELEHARQWDALGERIFNLHDLVLKGVLPYKAGGLDGCAGGLINATPMEQDCNAASAMFLRAHHASAIPALLKSERRALACSLLGPEPFETLAGRTIAFLAQFPSACSAYAKAAQVHFADVLEAHYSGAEKLWRLLAGSFGELT